MGSPQGRPRPALLFGGRGREEAGWGRGEGSAEGGASPARPPSRSLCHACWPGSEATGPLPSGTLRPAWGESWEVRSALKVVQDKDGSVTLSFPSLFWEAEVVLEPTRRAV